MSQKFWNTVRDEIEKNQPRVITKVYNGLYSAGEAVGGAVNSGINAVEQVSPMAASVCKIARAYAEDATPMFQDDRNK